MASLFHFNFIPYNAEKCRPRGIRTNRIILPWNYPFGELILTWKFNFALSQKISDCLMSRSRMVTSSIRLYLSKNSNTETYQERAHNYFFQNLANHITRELYVLTSSAELQIWSFHVAVLWRTSIKFKTKKAHLRGVQRWLFWSLNMQMSDILAAVVTAWVPSCLLLPLSFL